SLPWSLPQSFISLAVVAASIAASARGDEFTRQHSCITSISDLDGDGVRDLIVASRDPVRRECVWAISGKTGKLLFRVEGAKLGDGFGGALAEVGDVNKDGVPDFAVGAIGGRVWQSPGPSTVHAVGAFESVSLAYVRVL